MGLYFRKDGTPYPEGKEGLLAFAKDFENTEGRRVGFDKLPNGLAVSTVWLGIDHGFGSGRPLIFETMVFAHGRGGEFQTQYSTLEEARLGHKMMVKKCRSLVTIKDVLGKK